MNRGDAGCDPNRLRSAERCSTASVYSTTRRTSPAFTSSISSFAMVVLMSYAPDLDESLARVAALVDRVFKGARPENLPFEQPSSS